MSSSRIPSHRASPPSIPGASGNFRAPGKNGTNHLNGHIGPAKPPSVVEVGQALVIHSQAVKEGDVKIVDAHRINGGLPAVANPTLDASTRHPDKKPLRIVIPTLAALGYGHSPELPSKKPPEFPPKGRAAPNPPTAPPRVGRSPPSGEKE